MKRIIGIIFVLFSLSSVAAKLRNYGIDKEKVVEIVYDTTKLVFESYHDEWNDIMLGTLSAETDLGAYKGSSKHGIAQITPVAFKFIKKQVLKDSKTYEKLKANGIDFKKISFNELTHNHKASIAAMALYYKYVVETKKVNIHGKDKAEVWKKYYNTYAGAGTKQHFNKAYNRNKDIIKETLLVCKTEELKLAEEKRIEDTREELLASSKEMLRDVGTDMSSNLTKVKHTKEYTTFTSVVRVYKEDVVAFAYKAIHKTLISNLKTLI